jgi:hypothetical protein
MDGQLEFLHKDTFKYNLKLEAIFLWRNRITALHHQMFSHLTKLHMLELAGNICVDVNFGTQVEVTKELVENALRNCSENYPKTGWSF